MQIVPLTSRGSPLKAALASCLLLLAACVTRGATRTVEADGTVRIEGTPRGETLIGTAERNDLVGNGGNDVFKASGRNASLWGKGGDDRYVFGPASNDYFIYDEGGDNLLEIEGEAAIEDVRVRPGVPPFIALEVYPRGARQRPGAQPRTIFIQTSGGAPDVQTLLVGGRTYPLAPLIGR